MNNLYEILYRHRNNNSSTISDSKQKWTYQQVYEYIKDKDISNVVHQDETNIGIIMSNSIEFIVAYFIIIKNGYTAVPINPKLKKSELKKEITFCNISTLLVNDDSMLITRNLFSNIKLIAINSKQVKPTHNFYNIESLSSNNSKNTLTTEVAVLLQTSGTTSNPKKVMLTHNNILNNIKDHIKSVSLQKEDKVLIILPMYFGYCHTSQLLAHMFLGSDMYISKEEFFPRKLLNLIEKENIRTFAAVPSMLITLVKYQFPKSISKLNNVKYVFFGGGNMPSPYLSTLRKYCPHLLFIQTYGQTEASPRITTLTNQSRSKIDSVGIPLKSIDLKIVDNNSNELPPFNIGQIIVKGDNVMKGYYKNIEETKKVVKNGYLYTGDIGYLDNEGYLYLKGRLKNIIISSGINIFPEEIEEFLIQHDNIFDVIVKGKKHDIYGEIVVAFIKSENISKEEVLQYCSEGLADYKIPKEVFFVENIPKTYNGKNKRNNLKG